MKQKYTSQDELILRIEELKKASFHMQKKRFVLYQLYQKEVDHCVENIKQLQQAKWKVSAWEKKEFIHFLLSTLVLLFGLYLYSVATIPALLFGCGGLGLMIYSGKGIYDNYKVYQDFQKQEKEIIEEKLKIEKVTLHWHDRTLKMVQEIEKHIHDCERHLINPTYSMKEKEVSPNIKQKTKKR